MGMTTGRGENYYQQTRRKGSQTGARIIVARVGAHPLQSHEGCTVRVDGG